MHCVFLSHISNMAVSNLDLIMQLDNADDLLDRDSFCVLALPSIEKALGFQTHAPKWLSKPELPCLCHSPSDQGSTKGRCAFSISGLFLKVTCNISA